MRFENWGLIDYQQALDRQMKLVDLVASRQADETVILCQHPPVVTLGKSSDESDLQGWQGATVEISRGGRATYHGPSQIVVYPILNLDRSDRRCLKPRDLHGLLRCYEQMVIDAFCDLVPDLRAGLGEKSDADLSMTGVWMGQSKLASIGIAVRRWVGYHGIAVNLTKDPLAFSGIKACGFGPDKMTSLQALSRPVDYFEAAYRLQQAARQAFY